MHDVGGNFGTRGMIYPEFALVAWAARRTGRPVKWTCERHEAFLSDYQGRDLAVEAELALDAEGTFLAMRGSNIGNAGAHTGNFSPLQKGVEIMTSIYRIPAACFRARAVVSNTDADPALSQRRPAGSHVRHGAAHRSRRRQCGFDRVELRRRNLITEAELPYTNPFGMIYDSGDYHDAMEKALELGDWAGFPARQREARKRGKRRGIGVANYVDTATGVPRERAEITVHPEGRVDVVIGTVSQRPGPRDELRPARHRMARRADRARADHHRRHRHRESRRRHALGARDAPGQHRHLERVEPDHRERHAHRRAHARVRAERRPLRAKAAASRGGKPGAR